MEGQIEAPGAQPRTEMGQCDFGSCDEPASADIESQQLCVKHFISVSMKELDGRSKQLTGQSFGDVAVDDFRNFLQSCERQAAMLENEPGSDPQVKSRLTEILRRVSQLSQKLRRSPRFDASVPVWLRREDPGRTWEEQTWTSSVSRYGAGFSCHHSVDIGGEVILCRRDKGNRVRARVVYCRFDAEGRRQIGVELLDEADFWDMDHHAASTDDASGVAPADGPAGC